MCTRARARARERKRGEKNIGESGDLSVLTSSEARTFTRSDIRLSSFYWKREIPRCYTQLSRVREIPRIFRALYLKCCSGRLPASCLLFLSPTLSFTLTVFLALGISISTSIAREPR